MMEGQTVFSVDKVRGSMSVVGTKILIAAGQPQSGGDEEDEGMS